MVALSKRFVKFICVLSALCLKLRKVCDDILYCRHHSNTIGKCGHSSVDDYLQWLIIVAKRLVKIYNLRFAKLRVLLTTVWA